jgi:outer membrane protein assembly complex protein YaeT
MFVFLIGGDLYATDTSPKVWKVSIKGNEAYTDLVLREVIANRSVTLWQRIQFWSNNYKFFSEQEVRRDIVRLERFYERRGFPKVQVRYTINLGKKEKKSWRTYINFEIYEGRPITIDSVQYEFVDVVNEEEFTSERLFSRIMDRNPFQVDRRYELIKIPEVEGLFLNTLKNIGYAFATTQVTTEIDSARFSAQIKIILDPGPPTEIGSISVTGNETVSEGLIIRESALTSGQKFDQRRLNRAQQEIFSHHLFRFVTINIPEQPRDSIVDVEMRVRENPLRSLRLQGGVGTEELLRTSVSWAHRNPFGNAHSLTISGRASFIEQRANVDYLFPYLFNTSSSVVISPFIQRLEEKNFLLLQAGATNSFVYQYSQNLAGTISYEFSTNEEAFGDRRSIFRDSVEVFRQSSIKFSGYFTQSILDQRDGWAIRPYFEISGFLNTGNINFQRASLDIRRFLSLSKTTQLALRANGSSLMARDNEKIPASLLFYLGGTNSVRGWGRWELGPKRPSFDEQGEFDRYIPIGGRYMFSFNTEIRKDLNFIYRGFGIAGFLDGGQLWRNKDEISIDDLRYGLGVGLRYNSPIGPIRLDFAHKMNPTDQDLGIYNGINYVGNRARWVIHFNIGQAF